MCTGTSRALPHFRSGEEPGVHSHRVVQVPPDDCVDQWLARVPWRLFKNAMLGVLLADAVASGSRAARVRPRPGGQRYMQLEFQGVRTREHETGLLAMKAGGATDCAVRKPRPPNETPVVPNQGRWRAEFGDRTWPAGSVSPYHQSHRWLVSLETSAHSLVRTTSVVGTIHRQNGLSQLACGLDRLPNLRVDVLEGAKGRSERRGVVVGVQHLNRATAR